VQPDLDSSGPGGSCAQDDHLASFALAVLTSPVSAAHFRLKVDDLKPNALMPNQ